MHKLYGNNIRLTRGDTLAVGVGLWNADGTEYEPNATYFATARAAELDQAASKFRLVGKVYRVEKEDAVEAMYREFYERFNTEQ